MRTLSKIETERLRILTEKSISLSLIEPTENGLKKSIMDATAPVRSYLLEQGIHNFSTQTQGPDKKVVVESLFIDKAILIPSTASLYRPVTKKGDPRIWFKGLGNYASPNDILGIIAFENTLYVINLTRIDILECLESITINPLKELTNEISAITNAIADELLAKLKKIALRGPIPAELNADTAVGRTLETLLGLKINSSKKPDYKGIELKSFREKRGNRKTLFAQVPDWNLSKFKSSAEILKNFGYRRGLDFKLYCTVSTIVRNSQGLKLQLNNKNSWLAENSEKEDIGDFVVWTLGNLHKRLIEKHNETFWISTESRKINGMEHFTYAKVEHTRKPIPSQFDILLEQGAITLDHLIKRNSKGSVIEKGPLFKIRPNSLGLLFPPSRLYSLLS